MDVALLLIFPVIGGYYLANNWNYTRFHSAREEGHRLYFRAVLYGTFLFAVAYLLRLWLIYQFSWYADVDDILRNHFGQLLKPDRQNPGYDGSAIVITSLYSLAIGIIVWWPLNKIFPRDWLLKDAVKNDDF